MKKTMRRLFAILMTLAIAITAIPMMEAKAAEGDIVVESVTLPDVTVTLDNTNSNPEYEGAQIVLSSGYENVIRIYGYYRHIETGSGSTGVWFYKTESDGTFEGTLYGYPHMEDGTYELYRIQVQYEDDSYIYVEEDNLPESTFEVANNITDFIDPEISNPAFVQNGQSLVQGSNAVLEFTADFSDEGGAGLDLDDMFLVIRSISGGIMWLDFEVQEDSSYKASVSGTAFWDTDHNTEWYVEAYVAYDKAGNCTEYYPIEEGEYWHFYVEDENGVCNKERNITVNFYDEEDELIEAKKVNATTREVVLADLLNEIPTYEMDLGFKGWKCEETGQMLEDDTVFISTSIDDVFSFYPVAEKRYVEVDLCIIQEDGEYDWIGYVPYLIEYDTTYQELITMLPKPESVNGVNFVEWDLGGYELTDVVEGKRVDLWAVYDKQLIEVYYTFMDEKGQYAEEYTTLTFAVDEKVTYENVVNAMPKIETYEGVNLVKWNVLDVTDLTEEVEYGWAELVAEYDKYPVFIERTYIDNTGAAKKEVITELYPAGTTMESIYNEYAVTPSDASTSLIIEGWKVEAGNPEEISANNNTLVLAAQYENESIVEVTYSYIAPLDDHGVVKFETVNIVVSKEITSDVAALQNYCKQSVENKLNVTHYEACGFEGWDYTYFDYGEEDDGYIDSVSATSIINEDDLIVVMAALSIYSYEPYVYVYVVEAGETLDLPWEYDGHYLEWIEPGDDGFVELDGYSYVVPKDATKGDMFMLIAEEGKELPGEADDSAEIVDENNVLPLGVTLRAILLEEGNVVTTTKSLVESKLKDIKNLAIYDITLVNSNGVLIEKLDKSIKVTLDIPFAVGKGNTINVFRVDGDELVQCTASISENKLSFETDHFSTYVFVEQEKEEMVIPPTDGTNVPKTGDSTNILPYITLLLLGAGVYMVGNKRRNFVR